MDAVKVSDVLGKMNVITAGTNEKGFNWGDRYNIWSGVIGGFFLALSYFGTDQSQVGRYLTSKSIRESRIGLLMNGIIKVPMQFLILLTGVLAFTFYQFNKAPLFFNESQVEKVAVSVYKDSLKVIQHNYDSLSVKKQQLVTGFVADLQQGRDTMAASAALRKVNKETESLRSQFKVLVDKKEIKGESNDTNYIFLRFVVDHLPAGLVGLLIAVIFLAAWGSIAAALNSLASTTVVDIHKKFINKACTNLEDYSISKKYTLVWGLFSIVVALFAGRLGSLIEAVNILGSLFYGVILGIFLVAFYCKKIGATAVFYAALITEAGIILLFWKSGIGFLWLNAIGALGVVLMAGVLEMMLPSSPPLSPSGEHNHVA